MNIERDLTKMVAEVVHVCGHKGYVATTIEDVGPEVEIESLRLCPSCQQKDDDERSDLWLADSPFDSEY